MREIEITIGDLRIDVGEYRCPDTVVYIKIQTLDDVETEGKTVLMRADLYSPIDPATREITDSTYNPRTDGNRNDLADAKLVILPYQ